LPPPPPACAAFASRRPAGKIACDLGTGWVRAQPSPGLLKMLDTALAEDDAAKRDALLVDVERCDRALQPVARALRADPAPPFRGPRGRMRSPGRRRASPGGPTISMRSPASRLRLASRAPPKIRRA